MQEAQRELAATVAARRELGAEHEEHLIEGFLARLGDRVEARRPARPERSRTAGGMSFVLALVSMGCAIPITAIALTQSGLLALLVCWAGIVLVNLVFSRTR